MSNIELDDRKAQSFSSQRQQNLKAYYNGRISSTSQASEIVDTLVIQGERVLTTGQKSDLIKQLPSETQWIDLQGHTVVPGFIDAHCHFSIGVFSPLWPDCSSGDLSTIQPQHCDGWIRGRQMPLTAHPTLDDLDEMFPDRPVILVEPGYHGCSINSIARKLLNNREPKGYFQSLLFRPETHGSASLTNLPPELTRPSKDSSAVMETAMAWAENISRNWFQDEFEDQILQFIEEKGNLLLQQGITCICDAAVTPKLETLLAKASSVGKLPINVIMLVVGDGGLLEKPWDRIRQPAPGVMSEGLQMGALKIFVDGGRQCLVQLPDGQISGLAFYNHPALVSMFVKAFKEGFTVACHTMANAAVELAISAFVEARRICEPPDKLPFRIEHAALLTNPIIERIAQHNVSVVVQPYWVRWLGPRWLAAPHNHVEFLPFRSLIDAGVLLAASSDSTDGALSSPIEGMIAAVSREVSAHQLLAPDQSVTPEEALQMYTVNAARVCGVIHERGTLESGKYADFVVLRGDPFSKEQLTAGQVEVRCTYVKGIALYDSVDFERKV